MKRLSIFIFSLLIGYTLFEEASVLAADCDGKTRQEHHVGNFNFVTSSWVDKVGSRRRYVSCVANLDEGTDLLVNWIIPGPHKQYVPADEVFKWPRLKDDIKDRPIDGCFEFGGLQETTTAQFLGTADDETKHRDGGKCGQQTSSVDASEFSDDVKSLINWADDVHVFFPSDLSNPHDTMLEVTGKIGIEPKENGFVSFFEYSAKRYSDREKGNLQDVSIVPFFPEQEKMYLNAFLGANKSFPPLAEKAQITFSVAGTANQKWRAVEAFYVFRDQNNKVLGAIPMPLFEGVKE